MLLLHGHFVDLHKLVIVYYILASIILVLVTAFLLEFAVGSVAAVSAHYAGNWFYELHFLVVRGQPEVDASRGAQ